MSQVSEAWGGDFVVRHSVLNAADYFRSASLHDGTERDRRMADAIEVICSARQVDGIWL